MPRGALKKVLIFVASKQIMPGGMHRVELADTIAVIEEAGIPVEIFETETRHIVPGKEPDNRRAVFHARHAGKQAIAEASAAKSQKYVLPFFRKISNDTTYTRGHMGFQKITNSVFVPEGRDSIYVSELLSRYRTSREDGDDADNIDSIRQQIFEFAFDTIQRGVDPTRGKYTVWVVDRYVNGGIRYWEDIGRVRDALRAHLDLKTRRFFQNTEGMTKYGDINTFKTLSDLEVFIRGNKEPVEGEDSEVTPYDFYKGNGGLVEIAKTEAGTVLELKTRQASVGLYQDKTSWCTAAPENSYFDRRYTSNGGRLLVIDQPDIKVQLHLTPHGFGDILDENDNTVMAPKAARIDQGLLDALSKYLGRKPITVAVNINLTDAIERYGPMTGENYKDYLPDNFSDLDVMTNWIDDFQSANPKSVPPELLAHLIVATDMGSHLTGLIKTARAIWSFDDVYAMLKRTKVDAPDRWWRSSNALAFFWDIPTPDQWEKLRSTLYLPLPPWNKAPAYMSGFMMTSSLQSFLHHAHLPNDIEGKTTFIRDFKDMINDKLPSWDPANWSDEMRTHWNEIRNKEHADKEAKSRARAKLRNTGQ
jgi:hypothetical protein